MGKACNAGKGFLLADGAKRLIILARQIESKQIVFAVAQARAYRPVFLRNKCADLSLALNNKAHRDRLHAASRQPARHFAPKQWRQHETHHTVEKAARLLSAHARHLELTRRLKCLPNSIFSDFIKHHAPKALLVSPDGLAKVPRDSFPFSIKVGRKINGISLAGQSLKFFNDLFLAWQNLVVRRPLMIWINAHAPNQLLVLLALFVFSFFFRRHFTRQRCLLAAFSRS